MDDEKIDSSDTGEKKLSTGDIQKEQEEEESLVPNIQIHGGCGLGGVTFLNDKPPKREVSPLKAKDDGIIVLTKHVTFHVFPNLQGVCD